MKMNNISKSVLAIGMIFAAALSSAAQPKKAAQDAEFKALIEVYYKD